jgi:hypothetical protein
MLPVFLDFLMSLVLIYLKQATACGILQRTQDISGLIPTWGIDLGLFSLYAIYPASVRTPGYVGFIEEEQPSPKLGNHNIGITQAS